MSNWKSPKDAKWNVSSLALDPDAWVKGRGITYTYSRNWQAERYKWSTKSRWASRDTRSIDAASTQKKLSAPAAAVVNTLRRDATKRSVLTRSERSAVFVPCGLVEIMLVLPVCPEDAWDTPSRFQPHVSTRRWYDHDPIVYHVSRVSRILRFVCFLYFFPWEKLLQLLLIYYFYSIKYRRLFYHVICNEFFEISREHYFCAEKNLPGAWTFLRVYSPVASSNVGRKWVDRANPQFSIRHFAGS